MTQQELFELDVLGALHEDPVYLSIKSLSEVAFGHYSTYLHNRTTAAITLLKKRGWVSHKDIPGGFWYALKRESWPIATAYFDQCTTVDGYVPMNSKGEREPEPMEDEADGQG